ncbi:putative transporter [Oscillatoria laete-virens NRMC-F 0139]|nr:putative transporter [Oscillatoria laete-virens]MDL5055580.1 putative transporter [Oscillatoria laete-virens NRMC-F 0139]
MELIQSLLFGEGAAHTVFVLSLLTAIGLYLGNLKFGGISLGIAGVLFAGLLFGHLGIGVDERVADFAREFGLILFVYTIGLQVGPGFLFTQKQGLHANLLAAGIVVTGWLTALAIFKISGIELGAIVGILSGATTNTPSLGAAQQALRLNPQLTNEMIQLPAMGYAVAYPMGILGIILAMFAVKWFFRVNVAEETALVTRELDKTRNQITTMNIVIENANLDGRTIDEIPSYKQLGVVISRLMRGGELLTPTGVTTLKTGDIIHAVGPKEKLDELLLITGRVSEQDLKAIPGCLSSKRIIVSQQSATGKSIGEISIHPDYQVTITRISRAEVEFTASPNLRLQFGDTVLAVGEEKDLEQFARAVGNSPKQLNHPQLIPFFLGISLGVLVGMIPFTIPGIPAPVKLGLAGGPLIVALILSRLGRIGPMSFYMPISANFMLREVGITLFLACVGLKSGHNFVATIMAGGWVWVIYGAIITLVPLLIAGYVARALLKMNFVSICGILSGSMTDPPALAFANKMTHSDTPSLSYASVYPLTMILRVLSTQILVILFL